MLESVHNLVLLALAIVGALRAGHWIYNRGWKWYSKTIVLLITSAAVIGFARQMVGGPMTDMRAITEVLATAGCIFTVEFAFRHIPNRWAQFSLVGLAGIFLYLTWNDSLDRVMGTVHAVVPSTTASSAQTTPTAPVVTHTSTSTGGYSKSVLCDDPNVTDHMKRNTLLCYD